MEGATHNLKTQLNELNTCMEAIIQHAEQDVKREKEALSEISSTYGQHSNNLLQSVQVLQSKITQIVEKTAASMESIVKQNQQWQTEMNAILDNNIAAVKEWSKSHLAMIDNFGHTFQDYQKEQVQPISSCFSPSNILLRKKPMKCNNKPYNNLLPVMPKKWKPSNSKCKVLSLPFALNSAKKPALQSKQLTNPLKRT